MEHIDQNNKSNITRFCILGFSESLDWISSTFIIQPTYIGKIFPPNFITTNHAIDGIFDDIFVVILNYTLDEQKSKIKTHIT